MSKATSGYLLSPPMGIETLILTLKIRRLVIVPARDFSVKLRGTTSSIGNREPGSPQLKIDQNEKQAFNNPAVYPLRRDKKDVPNAVIYRRRGVVKFGIFVIRCPCVVCFLIGGLWLTIMGTILHVFDFGEETVGSVLLVLGILIVSVCCVLGFLICRSDELQVLSPGSAESANPPAILPRTVSVGISTNQYMVAPPSVNSSNRKLDT
ncbi:uncharacterized protein LOC143240998 [Tachypleus tridentatus]|uniref:uncharacterized protein LOC143240998 n=1 Tax=Tachypleus tridentatus TaxID=6853 RepID=UPI003FD0DA21